MTGAVVSAGMLHSCPQQAAGLAAEVVRLIRTLITALPWPGSTLAAAPDERRAAARTTYQDADAITADATRRA